MQDFEVPRWEAAKAAFQEAFMRGYTHAKARLAASPSDQISDAPSVWTIDVPRRDVVDGVALSYAPLFEQAGRDAGFARRRAGTEAGLFVQHDPDHHHAQFHDVCRWLVFLDPPTIAIPVRQ